MTVKHVRAGRLAALPGPPLPVLAVILVLILAARTAAADPPADPSGALPEYTNGAEFADTVQALLADERYEVLDALADRLLQSQARTERGDWQLRVLYSSFEEGGPDESVWTDRLKRLERWRARRPGSPTAPAVHGIALMRHAWLGRGGGYAKEVEPEQWTVFRERMAAAREVLEPAVALPGAVPGAFSGLLSVALGEGWPAARVDELFRKAVARYPTYESLYCDKALWLLPRWHGKPGDWERFAGEASEALGGAEGDALFAQVVESIQLYYGSGFMAENAVAWPRVQRSFAALAARSSNADYHFTALAALAQGVGDRYGGRKAGMSIRNDISVLHFPGASFRGFRDWANGPETDANLKTRLRLLRLDVGPGELGLAELLAQVADQGRLSIVVDPELRKTDAARSWPTTKARFDLRAVPLHEVLEAIGEAFGFAFGVKGRAIVLSTPARVAALPEEAAWTSRLPSRQAAEGTPWAGLYGNDINASPGQGTLGRLCAFLADNTRVPIRVEGELAKLIPGAYVRDLRLADCLQVIAFDLGAEVRVEDDVLVLRAGKN